MSTPHALGRPEWAAADDAAADGAVADGFTPAAPAAPDASALRGDWQAAAAYYWAAAYVAMDGRDWSAMRTAAAQAADADRRASPEGALHLAVMGGCAQAAPSRPAQLGRRLPADQVATARRAVQGHLTRHAAQQAAASHAQQDAARQADASSRSAARADGQDAVLASLPVGSTWTVAVPHKLAKATDGLAYLGDLLPGQLARALVLCPGVKDGDTVRVTAHKGGAHYGRRYAVTGVVVG